LKLNNASTASELSESAVTERAFGELSQRPPFACVRAGGGHCEQML